MGLMAMSSFLPAWLDANWRTLERDGGQLSLVIFFIVFFLFPLEFMLVSLLYVRVCKWVRFNCGYRI